MMYLGNLLLLQRSGIPDRSDGELAGAIRVHDDWEKTTGLRSRLSGSEVVFSTQLQVECG